MLTDMRKTVMHFATSVVDIYHAIVDSIWLLTENWLPRCCHCHVHSDQHVGKFFSNLDSPEFCNLHSKFFTQINLFPL